MDTFMDKLASKINAQEMIRANSAAEAQENERLSLEIEEYKQCLQEMRAISMQNSATADEVAELVKTSMDKIAAIQAENGKSDDVLLAMQSNLGEMLNAIRMNSDKLISVMSGNSDRILNAIEGNSEKLVSELKAELQAGNDGFKETLKAEILADMKKELKNQEENVHKECVKVYRNVQAVITEETEKQTGEIVAVQKKGGKKATAALVCGILAMCFAFFGLAVSVLDIFGIFAMFF